MVSGRRTWIDLFMRPIMNIIEPGFSMGYYFYDLNAKFNYDFGNKDKLYVSGFFGRDKFSMINKNNQGSAHKSRYEAGLFWQNGIATVRWNHLFFSKLFSNLSFIFSDYTMKIFQTMTEEYYQEKYSMKYNFNSGIRDYTLKYDLTYLPNSINTILMGAMVTYHEARPNAIQYKEDTAKRKQTTLAPGLESVIYIENEINIKNKLRINPGFRLNFFTVPKKTYILPEPRLNVSYNFHKDLAMKASYAMMNQYMLLLSPTTIGLPNDLWVPITKNIRPQRSQQVALGLVYEPKKIGMTFSVEGYYKKLDHIIAYLPGSSFITFMQGAIDGEFEEDTNIDWESKITSGKGWSYGVEFLARKSVGKFTGWVAYTLSWAQQQFDELNFGKKFWARYDRRHDVSIVLMYSPTKRINLSLTWVYATGNALTLPDETYQAIGITSFLLNYHNMPPEFFSEWQGYLYVENYGNKNSFRMEAFHHLDIAAQFIKPHKKNKRFESVFEVSIYNVYNHKNPFVYMAESKYDFTSNSYFRRLAKMSIFPIVPSFTYSFRF
jgi:outer membrane receptor for ferrienterochelin and colicin